MFLLLGVLFGHPVMGMAAPSPQILALDVVVDPTRQLSITDITQADTAWKNLPNKNFFGGYQDNVIWFRLQVQAFQTEQALLTVRPTILDDVRLFVPQALAAGKHAATTITDGFHIYQQGDLYPYSQREKHWRGFSFALSLADDQPHFIYLRLETNSSKVLLPELLTLAEFEKYQAHESLVFGIGIGLLVVLAILSALYWWVERDKLFAYFLFFSVSTLLFLSMITGLLGLYLLPNWPQLSSTLVGAITALNGIASTLFVQHTLDVARISRRINQLLYAAIVFYSVCLLLSLAGHWYEIALFFMLVASIHIVGSFLLAIVAWRRNISLARYIVMAFGVALLCRVLPIAGFLGVVLPAWIGINFALLADVLRMMLLLPVITERSSQMKQLREQAVQEMRYMKIKRDWMAMLTHEIKTPLALISSSNQNIQILTDDHDILTRSHKITRSTQRIETLINNLLLADKFDMQQHQLNRTQFHLSPLIQLTIDDFPAGRIHTHIQIPETLQLLADRELIRLTLNNLLGNALKHDGLDSLATVRVEKTPYQGRSGIRICVHDSGTPIPSDRHQQLFEKYSSFGHNAGSGIGLWACREIAHAHKGDVWLETQTAEQYGNTFCLWLPIDGVTV